MLTQRIGKSANEFLTAEGVSPEAVFLLGKDLNSFSEIAKGLLDGSAADAPAGHARPADQGAPDGAGQAATRTTTHRRRDAILGNLHGLDAAREAQTAIVADSEPLRKGLETVQERLDSESRLRRADDHRCWSLFAVLAVAGGYGFLRLYVARAGPARRAGAERSASRPSARSRKPSASTTPTRRRFCA